MAEIAASDTALKGRVILAATAGEETDSCGALRFVERYRDRIRTPVGVIIPEPTGLQILRAHRGILWLRIRTQGKTAHGSMPRLGINAIDKMNLLLNRLKNYTIRHQPHELLGGCSMSINRITGGSATNVVPEQCDIELDIRTLPGQSQEPVVAGFRAVCEELHRRDEQFRAEVSIIRAVDALETDPEHPFVQTVCRAVGIDETHAAGFTTDGPCFEKLNAPVLIFGPGDGSLCHKPNEYIDIDRIDRARHYLKAVMTAAVG